MFNKKYIAVLFAAALCTSALCGCGSESDDEALIDVSGIEDENLSDIGEDIEPVEATDDASDVFSDIDFDFEIEPIEPVKPADVSIDFEVADIDLGLDDIEVYQAQDVVIDFKVPELDIDFSDIKVYEPVEFEADFSIEHPELDFSDITMYEADDSATIKGLKISFADNVYAEDYAVINELEESELYEISEKKYDLLSELKTAFSSAGLNVNVDEISGEVTLDSAILFDFDKNEVSEKGKEFLGKFAKAYSAVVLDDKYDGFVKAVLVEGHTDTNGEYDYNLKLSQERADNVMEYCLSCADGDSGKLASLMEAVGYSFNDPVYADDGTVNAEASRRVSFRFIINIG